MSYWHGVMKELKDLKYPEQMAYLQENHGFSRSHANALIMYSRGSKSSKRFTTVDQYFAQYNDERSELLSNIFDAVTEAFPDFEPVIAWNQPMIKSRGAYVFGGSILKNHVLISAWSTDVLETFTDRLRRKGLEVNSKTIHVPLDWKIDSALLKAMVKARLRELD